MEKKTVIDNVATVSFEQYCRLMSRHKEFKELSEGEKKERYKEFLDNLNRVLPK